MPACSRPRLTTTVENVMTEAARRPTTRAAESLLDVLRVVPDAGAQARLEGLNGPDWDLFIEVAGRHGVASLLYHSLKTSRSNVRVPAFVMEKLHLSYLGSSARSLGLYHALAKVLLALRRDDVRVIVLKGAHLAELVYANRALRPMSDVDLLVAESDLLRVERVLLGLGYAALDHVRVVGRDNKHFSYRSADRSLCVEVHWALAPSTDPFAIDTAGQWRRARAAVIAGVEVSVLSPEDLLLHLCLHACEHNFAMGLKCLCDINTSLEHYRGDIDWGLLQSCGRQWGASRCAYLTLRLGRELLGIPVPDETMQTLKPNDRDESVVATARAQILSAGRARGHLAVDTLLRSERLGDRAAALLRITGVVFPSREVLAREYPFRSDSIGIYLGYPWHWRELLRRHGRSISGLLRGDDEMRALADREREIAALRAWVSR